MFSFLWDWLTRDLRDRIKSYDEELHRCNNTNSTLRDTLGLCENDNLKKDIIIERLEMSRKSQENIQEREDYWNNKYPHNPIRYKAQGDFHRDMRSLINYPSYIASEVVLFDGLNKQTEEDTLFAILRWCENNIKYVSDIKEKGVLEHWEDSDIVIQKREGDCEDKALVFKALTLVCGIPDYKVKIVAGNVEDPGNKDKLVGHAYPIILIKDEWYTFDPTYYPDYTPLKSRIKHRNNNKYKDIWWTFSRNHCFSQKTIDIDNGR